MRYSVIVPVYKNADSIPRLIQALTDMNTALENQLEVVFVVDGSPDDSFLLLKQESRRLLVLFPLLLPLQGVIIWILLLWLCNEAIYRIKHLDEVEIDARIMLVTSILGLGCNLLNWATLEYCCNEEE